jgi:hypothetical protein
MPKRHDMLEVNEAQNGSDRGRRNTIECSTVW